jgi:signal transduction histidine kinase
MACLLLNIFGAKMNTEEFSFAVGVVLFLLFLGAVGFALWFGNTIAAPLLRLEAALANLKAGQRGLRLVPTGLGALKRVAVNFNQVSQDICDREAVQERRMLGRNSELLDALTQLKKSNDALFQHEKLASLGRLAAGVAHEINNPTGYLLSNLVTLKEYMAYLQPLLRSADSLTLAVVSGTREPKESARAFLEARATDDLDFILADSERLLADAEVGAIRIRDIVQGLSSFAHATETPNATCNLDAVLEESLRVAGRKWKAELKVETSFGNPPPVRVVFAQLQKVFVHLLDNAGEAIKGNGTIQVRTWAEGSSVYASVNDTGPGIDPQHADRIFEPLYTTKEVGQGTGLGLSVALGILQEAGGSLTVDSSPGFGACFTVQLPAHLDLTSDSLLEELT